MVINTLKNMLPSMKMDGPQLYELEYVAPNGQKGKLTWIETEDTSRILSNTHEIKVPGGSTFVIEQQMLIEVAGYEVIHCEVAQTSITNVQPEREVKLPTEYRDGIIPQMNNTGEISNILSIEQ